MAKHKKTTKQMPFWHFIVKGRIISVRADDRVTAFRKARTNIGMAS